MDLLERYLQAIGRYLPDATRNDTLAELRENLLSQIEAREDELARPLTPADIAQLLRAHGKPTVVALRYLPQRSLIGPEVFPFYLYTLKKLLPLVVVLYFIGAAIEVTTASKGEPLPHLLATSAAGILPVLLQFWAWMTLVFFLIDAARNRPDVRAKLLAWDPMKLPPVQTPQNPAITWKSQIKRTVDLLGHCLWFAYVLWVPWHPFYLLGPGVAYFGTLDIALAPVWHTFYIVLIVSLAAQLLIKALVFVPSLAKAATPLELGSHVLGLITVGILASSSALFVAASNHADLRQLADVNQGISIALRIAFAFALVGVAKKIWQYARQTKSTHHQFAF